MSSSKDFRALEELVARIQKDLAQQAEVSHDVKLPGRRSGASRQIDVLVREQVGQYDIKIVIDCKDYSGPVDLKDVEEFYGLFDDVGAQKGVLVCPKGFTKAAKRRAEDYLLDLYSPVDTGAHKWRVSVAMPALFDFRTTTAQFRLGSQSPHQFRIPLDFPWSVNAYDDQGNSLGFPLAAVGNRWNNGELPIEPGLHSHIPVFPEPNVLVDNGYGTRIPVEIAVNLDVKRQLYFGHLPVTDITGFKDEIRGGIITNAFTLDCLTPEKIMGEWLAIETAANAPIKPVIELMGLAIYDLAEEGLTLP